MKKIVLLSILLTSLVSCINSDKVVTKDNEVIEIVDITPESFIEPDDDGTIDPEPKETGEE